MTTDENRTVCDHARENVELPCPACPKRRYLLVPAEMTDGWHKTILDMDDPQASKLLYDLVRGWFDESTPGDKSVEFGVVEMSDEEVNAMPEV